ncbi:vacuolar amino acid permease [Suillus subalutaceus]|uniref:vacuolar amino acid permease n=1 Tax=Suillus subalutaceus TaxID=48586 RepID=UPI001B85C893|nr:vacuolar amino acid permease [Suillus subalutaceus]KAG1874610.1 vacuolar amino acid permease [Suillus subalutaceus]
MSSRSSSKESQPLLCHRDQESSYNSVQASESSLPIDPPPLNQVSRVELFWILAGLWSAVFLGSLDGTIVATLLSPIGSYFSKSEQSSYLGTSYLLSVCCFTPLYGRLSDILGRKGAMLLGLTLFGSGTIACAFAPSMGALIVARAVAGMGGGGVMTVSSIAISDLVPLKQRGLYQGMTNILFGLGAGLGGPFGGWVNDTLGWRAAFLLQAPLLLVSFTLVALKVNIKLPNEIETQSTYSKLQRIDFMGSFTLVGAVAGLLLGFSLKTTEELPWSHPLILGLFCTSAVFWVCFILVEAYWAPYPVMPLRLITQRTPLAISLANFLGSMTAFSTRHLVQIYNVPLYFSAVRLNSSTNSGLHLLPHSIALSTGSMIAGWMMRRTGKLYYLTLASVGSTIIASICLALWDDNTSQYHLWLDIIPQGFGMASLITTTLIAMIAGVYKEDMAVATGITYLFRTTGQVLGVSLSGAVLQSILLRKLRQRITGAGSLEVSGIDAVFRHSISSIPDLAPAYRTAAVESYADALHVVFICHIAINILVFIACIPIEEHPLPYVIVTSDHALPMLTCADISRGTLQEQEEHYRNQQLEENDTAEAVDSP